jgi:hypothetical protein
MDVGARARAEARAYRHVDRIAELEAENARLREGLEMISKGCPQPQMVARGVLFHEQCRTARATALSQDQSHDR